jgi:hypothetical protein
MTTEQILDKWQALNADEQEKVLAFIDSLERQIKAASCLPTAIAFSIEPDLSSSRAVGRADEKIYKN